MTEMCSQRASSTSSLDTDPRLQLATSSLDTDPRLQFALVSAAHPVYTIDPH